MTDKPICLIIGAGDYIGAAIARRFARGGFHVVMGRRRGEEFAPLIGEIEAEGGSAQGFTWDARKEETAVGMFAMFEKEIKPAQEHSRQMVSVRVLRRGCAGVLALEIAKKWRRIRRRYHRHCPVSCVLGS